MPRNRTESELAAAGVASVKLRLSAEHKRKLQRLAEDSGYSMSDMVEAMIDVAWEETPGLRGTKVG